MGGYMGWYEVKWSYPHCNHVCNLSPKCVAMVRWAIQTCIHDLQGHDPNRCTFRFQPSFMHIIWDICFRKSSRCLMVYECLWNWTYKINQNHQQKQTQVYSNIIEHSITYSYQLQFVPRCKELPTNHSMEFLIATRLTWSRWDVIG